MDNSKRTTSEIIEKIKQAKQEIHSFSNALNFQDKSDSLALIGLYDHIKDLTKEEINIGISQLLRDECMTLNEGENGQTVLSFTDKFYQ